MAASRGGTLKIDDGYEWVCTSTIAEIDKDMIVQGYFHIIQTGEKREYGELHLRKLHDDYEIVVENNIAKGQRHELPAQAKGTTIETATVTEEPTGKVQDPSCPTALLSTRSVTWTTPTTKMILATTRTSTSGDPLIRHRHAEPRGRRLVTVSGSTERSTIGSLLW
jgi:hypothetical protein